MNLTAMAPVDRIAAEADATEADMAAVDRMYLAVYGPHEHTWPVGAFHLYINALDQARAHRAVLRETSPTRPRRASAGRRRRNRTQLTYKIHLLAPGAALVLLVPLDLDPAAVAFKAVVRDGNGHQIALAPGASQRLAELLQAAFTACWSTAQTWRADTNTLRATAAISADYTATQASGHTETDLDAWAARLAGRTS